MGRPHILIIGPSRSGKTTLARRISRELGYQLLKLDDLVSAFGDVFPELGIVHDSPDEDAVARRLTPFLLRLFQEWEGTAPPEERYVLEGVQVDIPRLLAGCQPGQVRLIGLGFSGMTPETLFQNIRAQDTPQDWTYGESDEALRGDVAYFLQRSRLFESRFQEWGVPFYDVSQDRESVFAQILRDIADEC